MTVVSNAAAAANVTTLRRRVRRLTGDNSSSSTRQRWSDADIDQAVIDQMFAMYAELAIEPAAFLTSTTLAYTATSESVTLPAAVQAAPIHKVEDYSDTNNIFELLYISPQNAETYVQNDPLAVLTWTRRGNSIFYIPKPTEAKTLRIWYTNNPLTPYDATQYDASGNPTISDATSQQPYPIAHEELITVGAAIRLQEEDDEIPPNRLLRYQELWDRFKKQSRYNQGRRRVANVRRFY